VSVNEPPNKKRVPTPASGEFVGVTELSMQLMGQLGQNLAACLCMFEGGTHAEYQTVCLSWRCEADG
jgi:hypothetical protein